MQESDIISYQDALKQVIQLGTSRYHSGISRTESVPLSTALGRVSAAETRCNRSIPEFNNSAMDGFALLARDTQDASSTSPVEIPIVGTLFAGDSPRKADCGAKDQTGPLAWEIMTGACLPAGTDTILRVEAAEFAGVRGVRKLRITKPLTSGQEVREEGEDFQSGDLLIPRGKSLQPEDLLAAATFGLDSLQVQKRPQVAILSTGSELVRVGSPLEPGKIFNSTQTYLTTALQLMGAEVVMSEQTPDDPTQFFKLFDQVLEHSPDILLTTGAVSMGKSDFIATALADLGAQIHFHKIRMRPGKPNLFASLPRAGSDLAVFSLPGNPISTAVGVRFLVEPYLNAFVGKPQEIPFELPILQKDERLPHLPKGLTCFWKAAIYGEQGTGQLKVHLHSGQASFMVHPLLLSNAWAVAPENLPTQIENGVLLQAYPLHSASHESLFSKQSTEPLFRKNSSSRAGCC